ncbi:hypothetical protein BGZ47_008388 [Haplosporangium gracile]|nr:hypothetical protein BGZ47_008388 [Haplosporangium gracile]
MKTSNVPRLPWSSLVVLLAIVATFPIKIRLPVGSPVFYKRDFPTTTTPEAMAPESESEEGIHFSKRRAMVYERVRYVGHPDFHKRGLPPPHHLVMRSFNLNLVRAALSSPRAYFISE